MRIVLDTNIFVSALMSHSGYSNQLLVLWQEKRFDLVTSDFQRDELSRVLAYSKIKQYVSERDSLRLGQWLKDFAIFVEPKKEVTASADPDDNLILGTAISGQAKVLVSGDKKHLLTLGMVEGIPILPPRETIEQFFSSSSS